MASSIADSSVVATRAKVSSSSYDQVNQYQLPDTEPLTFSGVILRYALIHCNI